MAHIGVLRDLKLPVTVTPWDGLFEFRAVIVNVPCTDVSEESVTVNVPRTVSKPGPGRMLSWSRTLATKWPAAELRSRVAASTSV
jgi:hypothetical protein